MKNGQAEKCHRHLEKKRLESVLHNYQSVKGTNTSLKVCATFSGTLLAFYMDQSPLLAEALYITRNYLSYVGMNFSHVTKAALVVCC